MKLITFMYFCNFSLFFSFEKFLQPLFIFKIEASTMFAPSEIAIVFDLAYDASLGHPLSDVVVDLKGAHLYGSECKNIISYVLHLCLFESQVKANAYIDELNQAVQH
jgi:hypothetical protein